MRSAPRLYTSTIDTTLGGLLFGFDTGVISGTTAAIQKYSGLSEAMRGFTVASAPIGTVLGSIAEGRTQGLPKQQRCGHMGQFARRPTVLTVRAQKALPI